MKTNSTQTNTYTQGVFVVVLQVVIALTTFFITTNTFAQEKEISQETQTEKIETISEEQVEKEITPTKEEIKPVESELSKEQLQQLNELDELLKAEKITQEEYDKRKEEIIGIKPPEEESLLASRSAQIEPEAQTLGKYIAPTVSTTNGSLNYQYPIVVPPGRNGLTPDLALIYNSGNKSHDSVIGTGWSFNIPYIQRVNKEGTNKLYTEDYFISSLDGELVDQGNGIYTPRTENGNFLKYEYTNNTWKVTDKTGTTYEFGTTAQARQDNSADTTQIFSWMLEMVTDTNGNTISYTYFKDQGQIYPDTITYGVATITFNRVAKTTPHTSYASAFKVTTAHTINQVEVSTNNSITATYDVTATNNLVKDITLTGFDGTSSFELPAIEVEYSHEISNNNWTEDTNYLYPTDTNGNVIRVSYSSNSYYGTVLQDVNGDSLPDILQWRTGQSNSHNDNRVFINTGSTWIEDANYLYPTDSNGNVVRLEYNGSSSLGSLFQDVNGDGLSDILIWDKGQSNSHSGNKVFINTGSTWVEDTSYSYPTDTNGKVLNLGYSHSSYGTIFQDVNGDALPDFVYWRSGQTNSHNDNRVFINTGSTWVEDASYLYPTDSNGNVIRISYSSNSYYGTVLQDVNGDSLPDILQWRTGQSNSHSDNRVFINTGSTWIEDANYLYPTDSNGNVVRLEYNGSSSLGSLFQDVNGDGLPDILIWKKGQSNSHNDNRVFMNTGSTWVEDTSYLYPTDINGKVINLGYSHATYGTVLQDVNGDSLPDFVYWRSGQTNSHNDNKVFVNDNADYGNISKLTNPQNGETDFTYTYARIQDASNKVPFPVEVVESITTNDNNGNTATTSYEYREADYYFNTPTDKKFAGFGSVIKTNPDGSEETTKYHQANGEQGNEPTDSYAKIGKAYEQTIEDSKGDLFTRTRTNYTENNIGGIAKSIQTTSQLTQQYDGTSSHTDTAIGYEYDAYGNVETQTQYGEVNGNTDGTFADSGTDKRTVDYTYSNDTTNYIVGLPTNQTLKNNAGTKEAEINYSYDTDGNLLTKSDWITGLNYADTSYTYNSYGLPLTETDALNNTTMYVYDTHTMYPASVTNLLSQVTSYTYDYSSGKVTQITEPNGKVTSYDYDGLDRLIEVAGTIANGGTEVLKSISYNTTADPQYSKTTSYTGTESQDVYTYTDGFGKTIQTKSEMDSGWLTLDTVYDEMNRVEKQSLPYETSSSSHSNATSSNNLLTSFTYDAVGRVLNTTNAKGTKQMSYDGFETSITDAENNQKDLVTDAFGNLVEVKEHNNGSIYTTNYDYNAQNLLTKIIDAENNERNIGYDGLGRRTSLEDLHATGDTTFGTWNFNYDDINLTSQTDPKGTTTSYTYDALNRVLTEDNTSTVGTDITYTYDSCTYGTGQVCSITTPDVTTNYTYLKQGLVDTESRIIDGTTYITDTDYDRQGNVTKTTHPNAAYTEYGYNTRGLVDDVKYNGTSLVTADYGVHGRPTSQVHSNGITSIYSYDANNLYELTNKTTSNGTTNFQDLSYSYDNVGNITQIVDASNTDTAKTQSFTYDDLYRLTQTNVTNSANTADYTRNYTYSPIGNITAFNGVNYTYTDTGYSNPHAVTNIGGTAYTYDNNGNLTNDGTWNHTWDYRNRLMSSTDGTNTSTYTYDHDNQRIKLVEGSDTTIYPSSSYEVKNGNPKVSLNLNDTLVATDDNGTMNHVHTDHLGGTNITTDTAGVITQTLDYYPFGETRIDVGTDNETKQFTGYVKDASTGLQYAGARYYTGNIGRFISQDPAYLKIGLPEFEEDYNRTLVQHLVNPQALNSYTYALNNPVIFDDENGEIAPLTAIGYGLTALGIIDLTFNAVEADLMAQYPEQFSIEEMDKLRDETIFKAATGVFGTTLKGPEAILYDAGLITLEELAPYVESSNNDIEKNIHTDFSPSSDVLQYQIMNNNFDSIINQTQNQTDPLQETISFVKETYNNLHSSESTTTEKTENNRTNQVRKKRNAT